MQKEFFKAGDKVVIYREVKNYEAIVYSVGAVGVVTCYCTIIGDKGPVLIINVGKDKSYFVPQSALKRVEC